MFTIENLENSDHDNTVTLTREQTAAVTVTFTEDGDTESSTLSALLFDLEDSYAAATGGDEDADCSELLEQFSTPALIHFAEYCGRDIEVLRYELTA